MSAALQPAQAQIQPDATLGATPSTVRNDFSTGQLLIGGGAPRGNTLFHSFSDFNIAPDGNAYFVNPDNIAVIVSRVTGESESNLLGTLGVLGEADLFFINPNGISFGANSALDLNGSFVVSTADEAVFDDSFTFSATIPAALPLLSVSTPTGLQFGQQPGPIRYQAERASRSQGLIVNPGNTLALLGGELDFKGANLLATGGRIELASILDEGLVALSLINQGITFNFEDIETFGSLFAFRSDISTSTITSLSTGVNTPDIRDGDIVIQADDVVLERSTLIRATTSEDISGGDIIINASRLAMNSGSQLSASALTVAPGDIAGNGGNIILDISEEITVQGGLLFGTFSFPTAILSVSRRAGGSENGRVLGNSGDILINTQRLSVEDGAEIATGTASLGDGGDIRINATESVNVEGFLSEAFLVQDGTLTFRDSVIATGSRGAGTGGDLIIETGRLTIANAGSLDSQANSTGSGGNVEIFADVVEVAGTAVPMFDIPNNSFFNSLPVISEVSSKITAAAIDDGRAGNISINARRLNLKAGGEITSETQQESSGNGGLLAVNVSEEIRIDGVSDVGEPSGLFSSTEGSGNAGEVQLETQQLTISNGGAISAATLSDTAESSGSLNLRVNHLSLNNGQLTVETEAQGGNGAEIIISDLDVLLLRNGSLISAEAINNANGGNIRIDASEGFVVAPFDEDSDILARANLGNGGNIDIVAQSILGLAERSAIRGNGTNDIDASSSFGASGTVLLNELNVNPAVEDVELPDNTRAAEVAQRCNPSQEVSSFVATGRGGVPPEPQAAVPEILWRPDSQAQGVSATTAIAPPAQLVEAQGWQTNESGQIVLTAATTETVPYAIASSATRCSLTDLS